MMKPTHMILAGSVIVGLLVWVAHALVDSLVFSRGPFLDQLALSVPSHELFIRSISLLTFVLFGVILATILHRRDVAEKALRESEERFRSMVDTTSHWGWEVDMNGVYTYVNPKVRDTLGYEPEEILGKTPFDLMPPDEAERVKAIFEDIVATRSNIDFLENTNLHKDGRLVVLETTGVPILDSKGNLLGYRGTDQDITDRKRAQEALKESEEKYRAIFNNAQVGLFRTRVSDGMLLEANDRLAEAFGYPNREAIIRNFMATDRYVDAGTRERMLEELNRTGEVRNLEARMTRADGGIVWFRYSARLYREKGYLEGVAIDITEQKEAEEALVQYRERLEELVEERTRELREIQEKLLASERLAVMGQFSGSISHEIRNPLSVIAGSVYFLKRRFQAGDEKVLNHLDKIQKQVDYCSSTIDSILRLTRMEPLELELVDLVEILHSSVDSSNIPESIALNWELSLDGMQVMADPGQLRMAFKNVMQNAIQAMPDGGSLTLSLRKAAYNNKDHTEIRFSDTGPGIDPDKLERVFEPLFTTRAKGIGFGLPIVKMAIEKHGGSVEAEANEDEGATIIIRLPIA